MLKTYCEKNKMDKNSLRRIIEDHVANLEGNGFQDFCDRLGIVLYPGDYTPVRPGGSQGDMKNDGYCPKARVFFAAHATRGEQIAATKAKITTDLKGCVQKHSDVKTWVYLTNDTLPGAVETYIDEDLRPNHEGVDIETWGHKKIASKTFELPIGQIEYILGINLKSLSDQQSGPLVDVTGIGPRGGSSGHFERFSIKNIGDEPAIDCRLSIVGDDYDWSATDPRLPKTLDAGESLNEIELKISDEKIFDEEVANLKVMLEYENRRGVTVVTSRDISQQRVPSGLFFNLKKGKLNPPTAIEPAPNVQSTPAAPPAYPVDSSAIIKEDDYNAEVARLKGEIADKMHFFNTRHGNSSVPQTASAALTKQYQPKFDELRRRKQASDRLYELEAKEANARFDELVEKKNSEHVGRGTFHSGFRGQDIEKINASRDIELEKLKIKYGRS
jgi:hypothetical protein